MDGETTLFVGSYYEQKGSQVTKYYFAGASRIAMRKYTIPFSMAVEYLLTDHLGSTTLTTNTNGTKVSEIRYKPWGEIRYSWTSNPSTTPAYKLTSYTFTGQYSDSYINLLWYGSRHYDPALGRFISPDSIVPLATQGVQAWDRFAYTNNNPVRYVDPSGHMCSDPEDPTPSCENGNPYPNNTQPLPPAPVVINNPDPLEPGLEQDEPMPILTQQLSLPANFFVVFSAFGDMAEGGFFASISSYALIASCVYAGLACIITGPIFFTMSVIGVQHGYNGIQTLRQLQDPSVESTGRGIIDFVFPFLKRRR